MSVTPRAVDVLEALDSGLVYLPGGRDREGRPLIVVNIQSEPQPTTKATLEALLRYFMNIFSEETKSNGFTILVDAHNQREAWRVARGCIRQASAACGSNIAVFVIVLRSDGFWEKHVDNCTKSHKVGEPLFIPLTKLFSQIESSQLTPEFGGSKAYNHSDWIQTRIHVEDYLKDAGEVAGRLSNLRDRLCTARETGNGESQEALRNYAEASTELRTAARHILHSGRNFAVGVTRDSSQDVFDTVKRVQELLDSIEVKQVEVGSALMELERHLAFVKEIKFLEEGVARVTNWILGPADAMLNSRHRVGFDVASSEELRREHEALELQCRETYGRYAELLHKIDYSIPEDSLPEDLKSQRDFMDFVCRSFASRLERRRNVLITSQRFFRLVSEYFDRTSEVFDKLVMGNKVENFSQAGAKLFRLERNQSVLDAIELELVKEGEKLSDILSMPVKDALGRDIRVDYGEDIVNVRDILDATNARKNIFSDSVELQKLTLKQVALIHTYENDAEQAVQWIGELFKVLVKNHVQIGCNVNEIQSQKDEHLSFQETAKGTYDYGCQLLNGARVLRMSCRLSLKDNTNLSSKLWQAWRQLRSVGQEQLARLRVCAVFHRSVEGHCARLRDLIESVVALRKGSSGSSDSNFSFTGRNEIRELLTNREKLLLEVGRMVRLGRLLRTRLKEPLCPRGMSDDEALVGGGNLTAVEAISTRLAEVTHLAERLDSHLCEAGAKSDDTGSQAPSTSSPVPTIEQDSDSNRNEVDGDVAVPGIKEIIEESRQPSDKNFQEEDSPSIKKNDAHEIQERGSKDEDLLTNNLAEDIVIDDYSTATECSITPAVNSRSTSFETASECGDGAWWDVDVPASDVENVEIPDLKGAELCSGLIVGEVERRFDDTVGTRSDLLVLPSGMFVPAESVLDRRTTTVVTPEIDRSSASSTVVKETSQEKCGKVMKEVTETTTLRVSHSTHFGVTSYKLTSNTLRNENDHTDIKEIHDLREIIEQGLSPDPGVAEIGFKEPPKEIEKKEIDEFLIGKEVEEIRNGIDDLFNSRKDSTSQESDASQESVREHSRLLKFTTKRDDDVSKEEEGGARAGEPSSLEFSPSLMNDQTKENIVNSLPADDESIIEQQNDISFDKVLPVDDSGIETTPERKKNSRDEDDELLQRMKEVSRNGKTGNSEDAKGPDGLINHCLIKKRAVRSAARFDFMLGEIC